MKTWCSFVYSVKNKFKFGIPLWIGLLFLASFGCERRGASDAQLNVRFPSRIELGVSKTSRPKLNETRVKSVEVDGAWGKDEPQNLTDVVCYALAVTIPESADSKTCKSAIDEARSIQYHRLFGPVAAGSSISVQLPSGNQRRFYIIGFAADTLSDCSQRSSGGLDKSKLSAPFVLGSKSADLVPGENNLELSIHFDGDSKLTDCAQWTESAFYLIFV